jgi:hypothetical protein
MRLPPLIHLGNLVIMDHEHHPSFAKILLMQNCMYFKASNSYKTISVSLFCVFGFPLIILVILGAWNLAPVPEKVLVPSKG